MWLVLQRKSTGILTENKSWGVEPSPLERPPVSWCSPVRMPLLLCEELERNFLGRNSRCRDSETGRSLMRNRNCDLRLRGGKESRRR